MNRKVFILAEQVRRDIIEAGKQHDLKKLEAIEISSVFPDGFKKCLEEEKRKAISAN